MLVRAQPVRVETGSQKPACACGGKCSRCAAGREQHAEAKVSVVPGQPGVDFSRISILPPVNDRGVQLPEQNEFGDTGTDGGAPGAVPAGAASGPCGCCVQGVSIGNVSRIDTAQRMGHSFDLTISMTFPTTGSGGGGTTHCDLEWWERTNVPYHPSMKPNTWTDMFALVPTSPTFAPWHAKQGVCDTSEGVVIHDIPSLGRTPGRTVNRTLEFDVKVKSRGAECPDSEKHATATQVLDMVAGAPNWAASSFTT
jgi:hypothetical protein